MSDPELLSTLIEENEEFFISESCTDLIDQETTSGTMSSVTLYSSSTLSSSSNAQSDQSWRESQYLPSSISFHSSSMMLGLVTSASQSLDRSLSLNNSTNTHLKLNSSSTLDESASNSRTLISDEDCVNLINDLVSLRAELTKFKSDWFMNHLRLELSNLVEKFKSDLNDQFLARLEKLESEQCIIKEKLKSIEEKMKDDLTTFVEDKSCESSSTSRDQQLLDLTV